MGWAIEWARDLANTEDGASHGQPKLTRAEHSNTDVVHIELEGLTVISIRYLCGCCFASTLWYIPKVSISCLTSGYEMLSSF